MGAVADDEWWLLLLLPGKGNGIEEGDTVLLPVVVDCCRAVLLLPLFEVEFEPELLLLLDPESLRLSCGQSRVVVVSHSVITSHNSSPLLSSS